MVPAYVLYYNGQQRKDTTLQQGNLYTQSNNPAFPTYRYKKQLQDKPSLQKKPCETTCNKTRVYPQHKARGERKYASS